MALPSTFTHLHVHTHYSLLDGATRIGALVSRVKADGGKAVAITDHGNMFGTVQFYQAARSAGIKPILGMEAYMAPGDRRNRDSKKMGEASNHLLLLARDRTGYQNLMKLSSIAYREGFYYRPRIDREVLREYGSGLICTSTCLGGEIPQALIKENRREAEEIAKMYLEIFGAESFFIELQDHGMPEQQLINPELADLAKKLGIGTVVTNDVHYLEHEDVEAHDILCCINTGSKYSDTERFKLPTDQLYLKTREEMQQLFKGYPDALANTERIADACNVELEFGKTYAPVYRVPAKKTDKEYLTELVYAGAKEKYGTITPEIKDRIDFELEVISSKGFCSYFLIVWDFVQYAISQGIPCGARGSGCSTVVGYCLGMSSPDPLRYELYFERFMDPDRAEMPDIDIDICQENREKVIEYVRGKYGHVAQVITYGTLKAKAVVKDVSRVLGLEFHDAQLITKLIPDGLKVTIQTALDQEPELRRRYNEDATVRKVIDVSKRLEGLARHVGVHAAGVVIADQPLDTLVPLFKRTDSEQIITQFDGPGVEKCGLLKMDFLGLKTLSVVERARQLAEANHKTSINLEKLDLTDQRVFALFARGDTKGVFQFESDGMRNVLMKMRPTRIEDLIAANALYRPGPMAYIDTYVARKHGEQWTTPHAIMTDVLKETYGILVYQEQVARLANRLGDIERKQSFRLAKSISKKKTAEIEALREPFLAGCAARGLSRTSAEQIFQDVLKFGEYAFNKAHATGYALLAFKTAYMKVYYPAEYMAALLTFEMDSTDKVVTHIDECKRMGIDIAAPDINSSVSGFTVVQRQGRKPQIRFGLTAVKGVGERAVGAILAARDKGGPFRSLFDFCERVDPGAVNRSVLESLIKCGAFDSTGAMRAALMSVAEDAIRGSAAVAADRKAGQMLLFGGNGHHDEPQLPDVKWSESVMLGHEKATLGFYVTKHPLSSHAGTLDTYGSARINELSSYGEGSEVIVGGMITHYRTVLTKKGRKPGQKMGIVTLEDLTGQVETVFFPDQLEQWQSLLVPEAVVFVRGKVDRKRQEPSLLASEVIPLAEVEEKLSSGVLVRAGADRLSRETLKSLAAIAARHPGDRTLYLRITTADGAEATIRSNRGGGVRPSDELRSDVEELLGPGSLIVLPPRRAVRQPPPTPPTDHQGDTGGDDHEEAA